MDLTVETLVEASHIIYFKMCCLETYISAHCEPNDGCISCGCRDTCEYCSEQSTLKQQIDAFRVALCCIGNYRDNLMILKAKEANERNI